jgi:hypothetical protein
LTNDGNRPLSSANAFGVHEIFQTVLIYPARSLAILRSIRQLNRSDDGF